MTSLREAEPRPLFWSATRDLYESRRSSTFAGDRVRALYLSEREACAAERAAEAEQARCDRECERDKRLRQAGAISDVHSS